MDQSELKYFQLCNELYKLNDMYRYIYNMPKRDEFEESVLLYIKKQMRSINGSVAAIERKNKKDKL